MNFYISFFDMYMKLLWGEEIKRMERLDFIRVEINTWKEEIQLLA